MIHILCKNHSRVNANPVAKTVILEKPVANHYTSFVEPAVSTKLFYDNGMCCNSVMQIRKNTPASGDAFSVLPGFLHSKAC